MSKQVSILKSKKFLTVFISILTASIIIAILSASVIADAGERYLYGPNSESGYYVVSVNGVDVDKDAIKTKEDLDKIAKNGDIVEFEKAPSSSSFFKSTATNDTPAGFAVNVIPGEV